MKSKGHSNGENSKKGNDNSIVKSIVFYVISIFLSVIIIMISITIMTTVVLLGYRLNSYYYYLIFIVISINIGILAIPSGVLSIHIHCLQITIRKK